MEIVFDWCQNKKTGLVEFALSPSTIEAIVTSQWIAKSVPSKAWHLPPVRAFNHTHLMYRYLYIAWVGKHKPNPTPICLSISVQCLGYSAGD